MYACLFFRPTNPSRSVLGHCLDDLAAEIEARDSWFFLFVLSSVLPTPSSAKSWGAVTVICLLILWHRTECFCCICSGAYYLVYLCCAFSARHFLPSRDCGLCHLSVSCWFWPFRLAPVHEDGLRQGVEVGFLCHSACALFQFTFLRLTPLRHGGSGEVFDGGFPDHSAVLRLAPPATLAVRD